MKNLCFLDVMSIVTFLLGLSFWLWSQPIEAQNRKALLIGISNYSKYPGSKWSDIHGKEDVSLLSPVLKKQGFVVDSLTDSENPTKSNIVNAIKRLTQKVKKGDIVYLHFSTHGQPMEDGLLNKNKDEEDEWDESIIPIDAGVKFDKLKDYGQRHLVDDELAFYVETIRKKIGSRGFLYVVIDACHAGTMSRTDEDIRGVNEGFSSSGKQYSPPLFEKRHYMLTDNPLLAPALYIEACKARECNKEIKLFDGRKYGSLSFNVYYALLANKLSLDGKQFENDIRNSIRVKGRWHSNQTLVVETSK